jgi:hypothetical protein
VPFPEKKHRDEPCNGEVVVDHCDKGMQQQIACNAVTTGSGLAAVKGLHMQSALLTAQFNTSLPVLVVLSSDQNVEVLCGRQTTLHCDVLVKHLVPVTGSQGYDMLALSCS